MTDRADYQNRQGKGHHPYYIDELLTDLLPQQDAYRDEEHGGNEKDHHRRGHLIRSFGLMDILEVVGRNPGNHGKGKEM